jgi:hypothetical protein
VDSQESEAPALAEGMRASRTQGGGPRVDLGEEETPPHLPGLGEARVDLDWKRYLHIYWNRVTPWMMTVDLQATVAGVFGQKIVKSRVQDDLQGRLQLV